MSIVVNSAKRVGRFSTSVVKGIYTFIGCITERDADVIYNVALLFMGHFDVGKYDNRNDSYGYKNAVGAMFEHKDSMSVESQFMLMSDLFWEQYTQGYDGIGKIFNLASIGLYDMFFKRLVHIYRYNSRTENNQGELKQSKDPLYSEDQIIMLMGYSLMALLDLDTFKNTIQPRLKGSMFEKFIPFINSLIQVSLIGVSFYTKSIQITLFESIRYVVLRNGFNPMNYVRYMIEKMNSIIGIVQALFNVLFNTEFAWTLQEPESFFGRMPAQLLFMVCAGLGLYYSLSYLSTALLGHLAISIMTGGVSFASSMIVGAFHTISNSVINRVPCLEKWKKKFMGYILKHIMPDCSTQNTKVVNRIKNAEKKTNIESKNVTKPSGVKRKRLSDQGSQREEVKEIRIDMNVLENSQQTNKRSKPSQSRQQSATRYSSPMSRYQPIYSDF